MLFINFCVPFYFIIPFSVYMILMHLLINGRWIYISIAICKKDMGKGFVYP